jgi:hypothetical protein
MTRWGWVLLIFELFLFVVILIHLTWTCPTPPFATAILRSWPNCR